MIMKFLLQSYWFTTYLFEKIETNIKKFGVINIEQLGNESGKYSKIIKYCGDDAKLNISLIIWRGKYISYFKL